MQVLTREKFRKAVFERDQYKCVICGREESIVAHHIIERRLWGIIGGYYLDNGASLCDNCHIKAEQTIISCEQIREAAGITIVLLPSYFYKDDVHDKWGNIILPNGIRLKGDLFYDVSVQKILREGGVLDLFCKYIKYPRTFHLPWSEGITKDDRILKNIDNFIGKKVVVSIKLDGENINFYNDYIHSRSLDGLSHSSQNWVKNLWSKVNYNIPEGWRVCGENMFAKHTIYYKNLETYFYVFSIWNEKNECLGWQETCEWIELLSLKSVPILYIGKWNEDIVKKLYEPKSGENECEGYIVRLFESFNYADHRQSVAKFVAEKFGDELKKGSSHWRYRKIIRNELKK